MIPRCCSISVGINKIKFQLNLPFCFWDFSCRCSLDRGAFSYLILYYYFLSLRFLLKTVLSQFLSQYSSEFWFELFFFFLRRLVGICVCLMTICIILCDISGKSLSTYRSDLLHFVHTNHLGVLGCTSEQTLWCVKKKKISHMTIRGLRRDQQL